MKRHSLRRAARIASCVVLAIISLSFGAASTRADAADANPVVIRYMNDHGCVPPFELANAFYPKGKGSCHHIVARRVPLDRLQSRAGSYRRMLAPPCALSN
jgi:hypothetical protein